MVGGRKAPKILQEFVRQHNVLLIRGIENIVDMTIRQATMLEVLPNQSRCKLDAMNHAAIIAEKCIPKPFEYMFIVLIRGYVICANKEVHQVKMDQLVIDR